MQQDATSRCHSLNALDCAASDQVFEGKASLEQLAKNWFFSYLGNFAGSLLMVSLVVSTGLLATAAAPLNVAVAKTSLTFAQACLTRSKHIPAPDTSLVVIH